ncbi:NTP transferase domain-containing protein [Parasphingopyxis sp.]|uniref:nucleotidyltransferase family protein n=1 Tax=Parasphingopyxis sp. TaxID=1920299 RepID=UPI00261B08E0|nr:NTP transferase domain-containing protein [Parasphingopyxis sp.]
MRAAIVLAAGQSRRFGAANKLLTIYRGKPLVHWAIESALAAPVGRVIVVISRDDRLIHAALGRFRSDRLGVAVALHSGRTRRASLLRGLQALRDAERESFVFLGDLPHIPAGITGRLAAHTKPNALAIRAGHRGGPGHPVLIQDTQTVRNRLDAGEAPFMAEEVHMIEGGPGVIADIDRPGDRRAIPRRRC